MDAGTEDLHPPLGPRSFAGTDSLALRAGSLFRTHRYQKRYQAYLADSVEWPAGVWPRSCCQLIAASPARFLGTFWDLLLIIS